MFDGWPYGEFTIEPGYKARGGEQELLKEIVEVLKRWNLSLTPAQKELER
jgi:hypothetical protein